MLFIKDLCLVLIITTKLVISEDGDTTQSGEDRGNCPAADEIRPCTCSGRNIRCFTTNEFDITQVFKAIGQGKSEEDKVWDTLEISSPLLTELKDNIFGDITFKTIKFMYCSKMNCVSPTAFLGMEKTLEYFIGYDTSFSSIDQPGCNLFDSLRRLGSLRSINITGSRIREIPDNAFFETSSHHASLTHIDLSGSQGGEITRVGANAFASLKGLRHIDLSSHQISKIESHSFFFEEPSSEYLTIDLESNLLTSESFEQESFAVNGRITTLKLGGNSNIQILKESVFRSFLLASGKTKIFEQNIIQLRGSPLQCIRQNVWILENKFKLQKVITQVVSAQTGTDFWRHIPNQCKI